MADQNVPTYYVASEIIKEKCNVDKITNSKISPRQKEINRQHLHHHYHHQQQQQQQQQQEK